MSKVIGKGPKEQARLMSEIEKFFEMNVEQRKRIREMLFGLTNPETKDYTYEDMMRLLNTVDLKIAGQPMTSENYTDGDGNPDGGWIEAPGLMIRWQKGAIDPDEPEPWNGCFLVTVLEAAMRQLTFYQMSKFACDSNIKAMCKIQEAIDILNERQLERFMRGVRGTHEE